MTDLSGPPEPIVCEDGSIEIIQPRPDYNPNADPSPVQTVELGTLECERCGRTVENRYLDGEIEEPEECPDCERQTHWIHAGGLDDTVVEAARKVNEVDEMWCPPGGIEDEDFAELWDDIFNYLWTHWAADETDIYTGLTAYALSTWVRSNLTFVPHLMLMGKTTGGKTRLLNTLKRVSYRAIVTASATPASMFRLIDGYDVSYYISEYHALPSQARKQLDNVVRAGQKTGEIITRAEPTSHGYEPEVYDPFTHVAIATQFTPADDIVNRCVQIRSESADRDMPATHDEETARNIRDRLLYARYRLLDSDEWDEAERQAYAYLEKKGIDGRTREKLLSLVTVAFVWDKIDNIDPFVERIVKQDREAAADSEEALVIEAIRDAAHERVAQQGVIADDPYSIIQIPYSTDEDAEFQGVVGRYEAMTGKEKSPAWLGHVVSRLGFDTERTRNGTVISDNNLAEKLRDHCSDLNLAWDPDEGTDEPTGETDRQTPQADAIQHVYETVERLQENGDSPYADRDALRDELKGEVGNRDPDELIESELQDGRLYEPTSGGIAKS